MTNVGLTTGEEFLRDAARKYFEDMYEKPPIHVNEELHRDLQWTPALRFVIHDYVNVFVEPSETGPYPRILERKYSEVLHFPEPIAIYAVCPEETIVTPEQQADRRRLQAHGFGLVTVGQDGVAHRDFPASPLVQIIPRPEFKALINGLTPKIKRRVGECYEDYNNKPVNGVRALTEVIEGMVIQAGSDAIKATYLAKKDVGTTASTLDALHAVPQCQNVRAEIGGVRSYIKEYRHLNHHWPKNKKRAHQKYTDCRHAFMDGIKQLQRFRTAMKSVKLSGNLPKG